MQRDTIERPLNRRIEDAPDCTTVGNCKEHGELINHVCNHCGSSKDACGRRCLHMAASCGRTTVCKYLVRQKHSRIDDKDTEFGYTALHRSIYYGKIDTAIALIQLGASLHALDFQDLTPLDHAARDNFMQLRSDISRQIYVWGLNSNYTIGANQSHDTPELLDAFHKRYPGEEPLQICLEKFHTAIVSNSGNVFTFGHGVGGRLGIGSEISALEPTRLKFASNNQAGLVRIVSCSTARDHSLFLRDTGQVWSCGLNTHHVLGIVPAPAQLLQPRPITQLRNVIGITCGRYHSVAWTCDEVYTWGLNGGQLGHDDLSDTTIVAPKMVTCNWHSPRNIVSVAASCGATAIATNRGNVFVLHEGACRSIASNRMGIRDVHIHGGRLVSIEAKHEELKILAWTFDARLFVWQESDPQLCHCAFSLSRILNVREVALNAWGVVLLTREREVFTGTFTPRKKAQGRNQRQSCSFERDWDVVTIDVKRVSKIYGADSITCDREGVNFAAIHVNALDYLTVLPVVGPSTMRRDIAGLGSLEVEADVTVKVGTRLFPLHRYVLGSSCAKLALTTEDPIVLHNLHPDIFQQVCLYAYTGSCDLLEIGLQNFHADFELIAKKKPPLRLLQEAAEELGVDALSADLSSFEMNGAKVQLRKGRTYQVKDMRFSVIDFPHLLDVRITSSCGNYTLAHNCILRARCEFFRNTSSLRWQTSSEPSISLPFGLTAIHKLLDYIYTDHVDFDDGAIDQVLGVLQLADYVLLPRLVEVCEVTLVSYITTRSVLKLLAIADAFNARQLKSACMEFVFLNLPLMLESHRLEQLDERLRKELTQCYSKMRQITPCHDVTCDVCIEEVYARLPVKLDFVEMGKAKMRARPHRVHRRNANDVTAKIPLDMEDASEFHRLDEATLLQAPSCRRQKVPERKDNANAMDLVSSKEFPALNASFAPPPPTHAKAAKTAGKNMKMTRLSQKERKRLEDNADSTASTSSPKSPENPWKLQAEAASSATAFGDIVAEERKQRENLSRIRSKSLIHIQIEDKAIEQLEKFYNCDHVIDETIRVRRVDRGPIATPSWVHKRRS